MSSAATRKPIGSSSRRLIPPVRDAAREPLRSVRRGFDPRPRRQRMSSRRSGRRGGEPRRVAPREPRLRYDVEPHGDLIYIHANTGGAEDFAIFSAPLTSASRDDWREVVPHRLAE